MRTELNIYMRYDYYYNNVPNVGLQRNNLIYTSLISEDQKVLVQWYHNDTEYHQGQNQVVDPDKMEEKYQREVKFLSLMHDSYPNLVPNILEIDDKEHKIYLSIDGPDFWQRSNCNIEKYSETVPDWDTQMLDIIKAHKSLGLHKYSMHPSSYFVVDGRLKSINYFFTYYDHEPNISIQEVESHIHSNRQDIMKHYIKDMGIEWDKPQAWDVFDLLCWESFSTNYPKQFIEKVKKL